MNNVNDFEMNKILKYIIDEKEIPIFFSCEKLHSDVLRENARSAGFLNVRFDDNSGKFIIKCFAGRPISKHFIQNHKTLFILDTERLTLI